MEKPCWLPGRVVFLETGSTLAGCDPRWWKPTDILLHTDGFFLLKPLDKSMRRRNPIQATCVSVDSDPQKDSLRE